MKSLYLLVALAVLGLAVFFVLRENGEAENEGEAGDGAGRSSGVAAGRPRSDGDGESGRRVKSDRVLRDRPIVQTTDSGLKYEVIEEGDGESPGPTSTVKVHYVGTLEDGTTFDSSRERGQPAEFPLNGVIKGWTEGLQLMKSGGLTRFTIPSDLAYGDGGNASIPGGATLIFEVELIEVVKP